MTDTPALDVVEVDIDELVPADYNPREISAKAAAGLARSIDEFGFLDPVIVNRANGNRIVGGHQRIAAARSLGRTTVPVIYVDLDDDREVALNLALNKFIGDWDIPKLVDLLEGLDDSLKDLAGFDPDEVASVRFHYRRKRKLANADNDRYGRGNHPELPTDPKTQPGDVYQIGPHRLYCADATDPAIWKTIDRPRLTVTSPPYPGAGMWNTDLEGDELTANIDRLRDLGFTVLDLAIANSDVVAWNIADVPVAAGVISRNTNDVRNHLDELEVQYREIVWDKGIPILPPVGHSRRPVINSITTELVFVATHEPVFIVYPDGWTPREKKSGLVDGQNEWQLRSVWNIAPARRSQIGHIAPFPIELAERCIYLYSLAGDHVLDPFAGAGSTLIAAERTGRVATLLEIEPGWCDLIVDRISAELDISAELIRSRDG